MNKKIIIAVIVSLLVLAGGVYYMKFKSGSQNKNNTNLTSDSKNIFTSVKDALSKKLTLVCEFKDDSGVSTKSFLKNGAVRVSSTSEFILKDKKMYMWDLKTKQGFVYDIPDTTNAGTTGGEINQSESYLNMIEKYKDSCKVATIEDSYFVPPTDVKFQDMSKLLEDLKKQIPASPSSKQ